MNINFDVSNLFAGFVFGVIGFYAWKHARKTSSMRHFVLAIALMLYPYFIENLWAMYGIGVLLTIFLFWPK
ncbi:MAG: hypothetical protein AB7F43_07875 [Bacteriovoracia bacterium]